MPSLAQNGDAVDHLDAPAPSFTPINQPEAPAGPSTSQNTMEIPLDSTPNDAQASDEDEGDEDVEGDGESHETEDELDEDVDPNAGARFFYLPPEDKVAPYSVVTRTVKELNGVFICASLETYNLSLFLTDMMRKRQIDLRPDYQRRACSCVSSWV
jgi:hypothetical protein